MNVRALISRSTAGLIVVVNILLWTTLHHNRLYIVRSGSMEPSIQTGSILLVDTLHPATYKTGDIITFVRNNQTITHRVVDVIEKDSSYFYRTQGDANSSPDHYTTTHHQVLGKTKYTLPLLGYGLTFLKTKLGFALIILVPATVVVLQELRSMGQAWRELRRDKMWIKSISVSARADTMN